MLLVEEAEYREGRILDNSSLRACDEPRLYRECAPVTNASSGATMYGVERSCAADYGELEADGYVARDPWHTQPHSGRPCPEAVWGYLTAMSREEPEPDRCTVPAPREEDASCGARRQQVPLDAPDVAL